MVLSLKNFDISRAVYQINEFKTENNEIMQQFHIFATEITMIVDERIIIVFYFFALIPNTTFPNIKHGVRFNEGNL